MTGYQRKYCLSCLIYHFAAWISAGTLPLVFDILLLGLFISDSKVPFMFADKLNTPSRVLKYYVPCPFYSQVTHQRTLVPDGFSSGEETCSSSAFTNIFTELGVVYFARY